MPRRFQFSLRTVLATLAIVAVAYALCLIVPNAKWMIAVLLLLSFMLLARPMLHFAIGKVFTNHQRGDQVITRRSRRKR